MRKDRYKVGDVVTQDPAMFAEMGELGGLPTPAIVTAVEDADIRLVSTLRHTQFLYFIDAEGEPLGGYSAVRFFPLRDDDGILLED